MRIKIGNRWYEPALGQPVMITLSDSDKANIAAMHPSASRYAEFDDGENLTLKQKTDWMDDQIGSTDEIERHVKRLDVENGDILVLRTAEKLTTEKADEWHDMLVALARRNGARDVTAVILDNCTDLTVERPGPAR